MVLMLKSLGPYSIAGGGRASESGLEAGEDDVPPHPIRLCELGHRLPAHPDQGRGELRQGSGTGGDCLRGC